MYWLEINGQNFNVGVIFKHYGLLLLRVLLTCERNSQIIRISSVKTKGSVWPFRLAQHVSDLLDDYFHFSDTAWETHGEHFYRPRCCFPRWCAEGWLSHSGDNQSLPSATRHSLAWSAGINLLQQLCLFPFSLPRYPISISPPSTASTFFHSPNRCCFSPHNCIVSACVLRCLQPHIAATTSNVSFFEQLRKKLPSRHWSGSSQPPVVVHSSIIHCHTRQHPILTQLCDMCSHAASHKALNQSSACHIAPNSYLSFKVDLYAFLNCVYGALNQEWQPLKDTVLNPHQVCSWHFCKYTRSESWQPSRRSIMRPVGRN